MNKEFLELFILQIEEFIKVSNGDALVSDKCGQYNKVIYLENVVLEAREFINFGESRIALENMLENIIEVGIVLDQNAIFLARKAFGEDITAYNENLLKVMTDKLFDSKKCFMQE